MFDWTGGTDDAGWPQGKSVDVTHNPTLGEEVRLEPRLSAEESGLLLVLAVLVVVKAANHSGATGAAGPGEAITVMSAPLGAGSWVGFETLSAAGHEIESSMRE